MRACACACASIAIYHNSRSQVGAYLTDPVGNMRIASACSPLSAGAAPFDSLELAPASQVLALSGIRGIRGLGEEKTVLRYIERVKS
jgi:hypothetical protein